MQLSYSASEKYQTSPRAYYFHYILRIRQAGIGSALLFGNAIDGALNQLLVPVGDTSAEDLFIDLWSQQEINGEKRDLAVATDIKYSKADLDPDILTEEDKIDIAAGLNPSWVSLQRKGLMIIAAYREQVMPHIKRVIAVQKHITLSNATGDTFVGFVDMICEWEDGRILIVDHKTSSIKYAADSVKTSKQLATYVEACKQDLHVDGAAYIVLPKKFRKYKEPRVPIEVIFGEISEDLIENTFQEYDRTLAGIKAEEFPCLAPQCNMPWGDCCYKNLCVFGDMTGLIEMPERIKK